MYPYHTSDDVTISIPEIHTLHLKVVYKKTSSMDSIGVNLPIVESLKLRTNLLKYVTIEPDESDSLTVGLPEILSLAVRALLRTHTHEEPEEITVHLPEILSLAKRALLQKLSVPPADSMFTVRLPQILSLWKRKRFRKHKEYEAFTIGFPNEFTLDSTCKPFLGTPVLTGSLVTVSGYAVLLGWEDTSITHTGYALYKDVNPIDEDTELEPVSIFDRDTFSYLDEDVVDGTQYYYRVTPISSTGKYLSEELVFDVPSYTGEPESITYSGIVGVHEVLYLGTYVIPLFEKTDTLDTTLHTRMYRNSTVTTGYAVPEGNQLDLSIYVGVK